ncbi:MAG: lamin tail domain-containing protein [Methanotrichaceae archaeon]
MLKGIVTTIVAAMLFVFPIVFFISQTVVGGDGSEYSVSETLVAEGNTISGGDIAQISIIVTGDPVSGGNSGGNDNGGSGGNNNDGSGGSSDQSNSEASGGNSGGDPSGGNGGSNGGSSGNSNSAGSSNAAGSSASNGNYQGSGSSGGAEYAASGQLYYNSEKSVVINKIYPYTKTSTEYGSGKVELYNTGKASIDLNQWYMKNMTGYVIGMITHKKIAPSGFVVVDVTGLTTDRQGVTLYDSNGNKIDSVMYTGAQSHNGFSYARISDGVHVWK